MYNPMTHTEMVKAKHNDMVRKAQAYRVAQKVDRKPFGSETVQRIVRFFRKPAGTSAQLPVTKKLPQLTTAEMRQVTQS